MRRRVRLALVLLIPLLASFTVPAQETYLPEETVRDDFLRLLDRPRVPLDAKVEKIYRWNSSEVRVEWLSFAVEKHADGTIERVPAVMLRKPVLNGPAPAVIVMHGAGQHKQSVWPWLRDLARKGFVAIAIDARHHGDRARSRRRIADYQSAIIRTWRAKEGEAKEHPFYFDTCWDIWRTIDYLQTRPDVDKNRIGLLGISMGGIETWLAGAVDERVKVAVPAISVQSFRWSLTHDRWQGRARTIPRVMDIAARDLGEERVNPKVCEAVWDKLIPGMLGEFDAPSMLRLFAGRPLLILNGENDPLCPIEGTHKAYASAEDAFRKVDAADKLKIDIAYGVGHSVTSEQHRKAVAWFVTWLHPEN